MCHQEHEYEADHRHTNKRRFCPRCAHVRKYNKIKVSNEMDKKMRVKELVRVYESSLGWDNPNILGY